MYSCRVLIADFAFFASVQSRKNFLDLVVVQRNLSFLYAVRNDKSDHIMYSNKTASKRC